MDLEVRAKALLIAGTFLIVSYDVVSHSANYLNPVTFRILWNSKSHRRITREEGEGSKTSGAGTI